MKFPTAAIFLTASIVAGMLGSAEAQDQAPAAARRPSVGPVGVAPPLGPDAISNEVEKQRSALLAAISPVSDAMLLNPPAADWLNWRRTYDAHGFSPLNQITPANAKSLQTSWSWSVAQGTSEDTPLVHDGVMFVYGNGDRMQALDATNGDLLWEYARPGANGGIQGPGGAGMVRRNIAIWQDKVIFPTEDRHMVALDVKTGKVVWDVPVEGKEIGRMTSGPLIVKGKVIQGAAFCTAGGCPIVALDANTGKELWRFYTVAKAGQPGGDSWNGLPDDQRFGGSVWSAGSYDPQLNLIYIGTGNTYHWQELMKGNVDPKKRTKNRDGLYIDSTLALDPDTGKLKWYYQHLPQDYWDQDFAFEQTIATVNVKGKPVKAVCSTGKLVWTDCVDAATGQFLFSHDMGLQNLIKSYDPKTGRKTYFPEAIPDLTGQRRDLQCSTSYSDKNWPAGSYEASSGITYQALIESCGEAAPTMFGPNDAAYTSGEETRVARRQPGTDGNIGRMDAVNWATGQKIWSVRQRAPITSAVVATAGGVIFAGDGDRWFRAYDKANGNVLWKVRLNDVVGAYPITYSVKGKQYVAVVTGCCGYGRTTNSRQLAPEIHVPRPGGSVVWVFALPDGA